MNNNDKKWQALRYLVHDEKTDLFEERTIILKADNEGEALDKGTADAKEYCESLGYKLCYIEHFPILDDVIDEFTEVYSTMRRTNDSPAEYIKKYIKTGDEINMRDSDFVDF